MIREGLREALRLLVELDAAVLDAAARSLGVTVVAVTAAAIVGIAMGLWLARARFVGTSALVLLFRLGMSVPTVLIGLLCFGLFSRRGVWGGLDLLYTPWAIVFGEFFLAMPIITTLTHGAIKRLDPRVFETALTLGAGRMQRALTYLNEARLAVLLGVLTAFSRCFTELGIAMMVGGNIAGRTRTLTTATAMETGRGEFSQGVAMCMILLLIAFGVTLVVAFLGRSEESTP